MGGHEGTPGKIPGDAVVQDWSDLFRLMASKEPEADLKKKKRR